MPKSFKKALLAIAMALCPLAFATDTTEHETVVFAEGTEILEKTYNQHDTVKDCYIAQRSEQEAALAAGAIATGALSKEQVSHERFCNEHVKALVEPALAKMRAIEIDELQPALESQGLKTQMHYATTLSAKRFIEAAEIVTADPDSMMIVQYDQSKTGMHEGRVFGILANVDAKKGKVEIMSVNPKQKKLTWIDAEQIVQGMQVLDKDRCPRGYLIASLPKPDEAN